MHTATHLRTSLPEEEANNKDHGEAAKDMDALIPVSALGSCGGSSSRGVIIELTKKLKEEQAKSAQLTQDVAKKQQKIVNLDAQRIKTIDDLQAKLATLQVVQQSYYLII